MIESIQQAANAFMERVGAYVPNVFGAIIILIVGWAVAWLVAKALGMLLQRIGLDRRLQGHSELPVKAETVLTGLAYYLILLYALLLTLNVLGIEGVLRPLENMFDRFLSAFPNIVAAGLIGFLGYVLARMLSGITVMLTRGLDGVGPKVGLGASLCVSRILGQLVFLLVLVPIVIAALDILGIKAISEPATAMMGDVMAAIPSILAATVILVVAFVAGRFVTRFLAEFLKNLGADELPGKLGIGSILGEGMSLSRFIGHLMFFFILLGAGVSAAEKLGMGQLADILSNLLVFAGKVALGMIILGLGNFIATTAYNALNRTTDNRVYAAMVRIAILALVLAMGLRAMAIADDIINLAFGLTLGAVALATALSFGLGGREAAGKLLDHWFTRLRK